MNIAEIQQSVKEIIRLLGDYRGDRSGHREMRLDPVIYGYFQARFGCMSRQHRVRMPSRPRPQRIDFRYGGNNPVLIEFAVRPPNGGGQLYGSQNASELRKLTRGIRTKVRSRVLLLIDLHETGIDSGNLKPTYDAINAGRGRFGRHSVRIIYVHASDTYHFLWHPSA